MHIKDLKTKYAPAAMVNWQEAGRTWPRPHPHAARLLRGLVWDQHYRHSHPQCEGGMPRSFELRTDIAPDRLQAVEDWLRAEGYEYRHQQRRWRTWTRPDRPGEGLRPDGIEEDEEPNVYPSGASINVSLWDVIEKNFPEPGSERRLQGSSSASPGKEKRSAGDKKRDRRWREYQESLAAEAAHGAKGGTPAPSPQRANGGHHPGSTTLGDYIKVAKQTQAKPRPLLLRARQAPAGPSSDVESAHRGRIPADQASSSSSVAPERDVARACELACGVPCNRRVARQRARQYSAAVEGAVGIAQEEAAEWAHGMAIHAQAVAAIAAGLMAVAAHGAATAQVNGELAAADEEARLTQEAIACKEAEVKALEEALAQERARRRRRKGPAPKRRLRPRRTPPRRKPSRPRDGRSLRRRPRRRRSWQRWKRKRRGCSRPGKPRRLVLGRKPKRELPQPPPPQWEEAEAKLRREIPPGASRVETLRKLFEGDAFSRMALDEADTGSSGSSGTTARRRRKGKGKTPERPRRPAGGTPTTVTPSSPPVTGMNEAVDIAKWWLGRAEAAETSPWDRKVRMRISLLPTGARSPPRPRSPGGATWARMTTWTSASRGSAHPRTHRGDPAETHRDPLAEDHQDPLEDAHQVDPLEADHRAGEDPLDRADPAEALLEDPWGPRRPTREQRPGYHLAVDCLPPQEGLFPRVRGRHGQGRDGSHLRGRRARAEGAGHRQGRDQVADQRRQRPAGEAGCAGSPWEHRQRPPTPGVWLVGRRLGTRTRSRQTPRPRRSPQESPQRQCPLSHRPLSPQRGPPQRARAARQWQ